MTDIFSPLAGESEAPQTPETQAPEPDASMAGALSGDSGTTVLPPSFGQTVAHSANAAAAQQSPQQAAKPGAWARTLLGGVMDALSGFVAGGGAGPQQAEIAQRDIAQRNQQKQQGIENQQKQQQMSREEAIARATIAHENASTTFDEMNAATLSYANQLKAIESGKTILKVYTDAKAPILAEGIDSTQLANFVKEHKLSPSQQHGFATAQVPVLGTDGQPQTDKAGNPVMRNTYTVVGDVPDVSLHDLAAQLASENTPYTLPPGSKTSGLVAGTILQNAKSAQTVKMMADEQLEKAGIEKVKTDIDRDALAFAPTWNQAMAKSEQNVQRALQYVSTDPQISKKYPNASSLVANIYGGQKNLAEVQHNQTEEQQKAEELAQKKQAGGDYKGDPTLSGPAFLASLPPDQQNIVKMIGEGRAPLNNPGYVIARKPEILNAVEQAYPGQFDGSKVKAYQDTYHDFTAGKSADALTNGGTALQHLAELKELNTAYSRLPIGSDKSAFESKLNQVVGELAQFYKENNIPGAEHLRSNLGSKIGFRDSAINTAAGSLGDKLYEMKTRWTNAAPSKAYEAGMPNVSPGAKQALAKLSPAAAQLNGFVDKTATDAKGNKVMLVGGAWLPMPQQ